MKLSVSSDFLASFAGIFVAFFACVWVMHGPEQSLKLSVIAVMCVLSVLAAVLNEIVPGITRKPVPDQAEIQKASTPKRAVFYSVGVVVFGLVIAGIGLL
jgi:hypothetical protein